MIIETDPAAALLDQAAELHVLLLPGSAISRLGRSYARSFYRFAAKSRTEAVFVAAESGRVIAAAVLSIEPAHLQRRLAIRTSLIPCMLGAPAIATRMLLARVFGKLDAPINSKIPEVIAIFTSHDCQRHGIGAALLRAIEQELRVRGFARYSVRTEDVPSSRAVRFYESQGFERVGHVRTPDARFLVMVRQTCETQTSDRNLTDRPPVPSK
jgi:ribosomal protein S18 acetylase RimI-like enzyme